MPLDVVRLLDSDLFILSTGDEFKAAVALWGKSWTQVPAGSLPDDDRILLHLAGAVTGWRDMSRDMVLRGWIKCSDGRLYHPVVAEKAMEALPRRRDYLDKKTNEADRKARERADRKAIFGALKEAGISCEYNTKTSDLRALADKHNVTITSVTPVTPVTRDGHGRVTAKTGTGTGTGTDNNTPSGGAAARGSRLPDDFSMPADWIDAAVEKGLARDDAIAEAEIFIGHWQTKTGKDACKTNWRKTWLTWVGKEIKYRKERGRGRNHSPNGKEYFGV